jgi:hypothetical protein
MSFTDTQWGRFPRIVPGLIQGEPGRGVSNITTVDGSDGTVELTFSMTDNTEIVINNSLVSDTLIALNELQLSGTNKSTKLSVENNEEGAVFVVDTIENQVSINPLLKVHKSGADYIEIDHNKVIFGNSGFESQAYLTTGTEGVIGVSGKLSQNSAPESDNDLVNKSYVDGIASDLQSSIEDVTIQIQDAQTDIDSLTAQVNASKVYTYFVANVHAGTLPSDHTASAVDLQFIMLRSTGLVYFNDSASGVINDPANHWVADANKYIEYFGPSGVRYRISYGLTMGGVDFPDRDVHCCLVKTTTLYPNIPVGNPYLASFAAMHCGDTDMVRTVHLSGEVIVTCTLGDKYFLAVAVNGTSRIMNTRCVKLIFEQL